MKKLMFLASILCLVSACTTHTNDEAARISAVKQSVLDSINQAEMIAVQQKTIDSLNVVAAKTPVTKTKTVVVENASDEPKVASVSKSKKTMNNTTKGALIGVGVGVVTGVATSKDKVKGGILGGVIGGSVGAGAGAIIDKKKKDQNK